MIEQLWMSGVAMAFLSFGIKTGTGMASQVLDPKVGQKVGREGGRARAVTFILVTVLIYLLLFGLIHVVVTRFNLMAYLDRITRLIQYGMAVHLAVAAGLLIWGLRLLLAPAGRGASTPYAGLFLVLPCPVCATVILLNLTLALSLSSLTPLKTTLTLFVLFWAIASLTLGILILAKGRSGMDKGFLGGAMVLIALYFFSTVLISPIYPKIKPAYAMALSNSPTGQMDMTAIGVLAGFAVLLSGLGFVRVFHKKGDQR